MNTYRNQIRAWIVENNRLYKLKVLMIAEFEAHILTAPKFIGPKPKPLVCIKTISETDHICDETCLEI